MVKSYFQSKLSVFNFACLLGFLLVLHQNDVSSFSLFFRRSTILLLGLLLFSSFLLGGLFCHFLFVLLLSLLVVDVFSSHHGGKFLKTQNSILIGVTFHDAVDNFMNKLGHFFFGNVWVFELFELFSGGSLQFTEGDASVFVEVRWSELSFNFLVCQEVS